MTDKRISAAERRWLLRELESWRNDSFISAEQAEKILTGYESKDELQARSRSRLVFVLFSMAALLFGLAVLLLIGFNWEAIPRGLKLFLCVGGLAAVQGLGLYLLHATRHRRAAEVLCFFGCLTFGAAIWLVAQAFHIESHYPDGVWWWAIGVLPFALLLDSLLLHVLFVGLLALWVGLEVLGFSHLSPFWFFGHRVLPNGAYTLLPLVAAGLIWSYKKGSKTGVGLYVGLLAWWASLQVFGWSSSTFGIFWLGCIGSILLVIAELHRRHQSFAIVYRRWGVLMMSVVLIALGSSEVWRQLSSRDSPWYRSVTPDWYGRQVETVAVVLLVCITLALIAAGRKWRASRQLQTESLPELLQRLGLPLGMLIAMAGFAIWNLVVPESLIAWIVPALIANAASVALAVYLIRIGMNEERGQPFFAGVVYFLLWAFARYLDLFATAGGMLGAAAFFSLCGAALVAVAMFWSRLRSTQSVTSDPSSAPSLRLPDWCENVLHRSSNHATAVLAFAAAAQVVLILSMIALNGVPLVVGQMISLPVRPVDPRDLFRGDYVILSYDVNQLPVKTADGALLNGYDEFIDRTVYVTIEPSPDGTWRGTQASVVKPRTGRFLRGRITGDYRQPIQFGIEAYYVQESKGLDWERLRNSRRLLADIAVAPWGQAKVKSLRATTATQTPANPTPP